MSEGLNRVTLLGNLGADPELRYTQGGQPVLNMRMATSESWFDKDANERKERTEWHNVVIWGRRGESLSKHLQKGSRILVEGSLRTSEYEARDGNKRWKTEINARNIVFAGPKGDGQQQRGGGGGYGQQRQQPAGGGYGGGGFDGDDIPF